MKPTLFNLHRLALCYYRDSYSYCYTWLVKLLKALHYHASSYKAIQLYNAIVVGNVDVCQQPGPVTTLSSRPFPLSPTFVFLLTEVTDGVRRPPYSHLESVANYLCHFMLMCNIPMTHHDCAGHTCSTTAQPPLKWTPSSAGTSTDTAARFVLFRFLKRAANQSRIGCG